MKRIVLLRSNPVLPDPPVEKMANTLVKNGYEVIIVGWDRDEKYYLKESNIILSGGVAKIIRFGIQAQFGGGIKRSLRQFIEFQMRLRKWLFTNRNRYDVIHAFDFDTGFIASKCAKKFNKPLIYHILDYYIVSHRLVGSKLGNLVKYNENRVIDNATATIICTEKRKEQIKGTIPKQLVIIHNTPEMKFVDEGISENDKSCYRIVYVGILDEGRFLKETIEFVLSNSDFELHVGGFGPYSEYISQIAKENQKIFFYGKIPYEETLLLESKCDVMIAIYDPSIPNHKYAAPNKFYESIMLGKPIIMAKGTGFDEIIEKNNLGVVIEYTREGLALGLNTIVEKKEFWDEMSNAGKRLYKEQYSWEIMEKRIVDLYELI